MSGSHFSGLFSSRTSLLAVWCAFAATSTLAEDAQALSTTGPSLPWGEVPYNYVILDQDIRNTLTDFGRNLSVPVTLTDGVKGRVRGRVEATTAGDFLDELTRANGLTWYYDGALLHISADNEFQSKVLIPERADPATVVREFQGIGLADRRFTLRSSGDSVIVAGPPAYVAAVTQFTTTSRPLASLDHDDPRVRVFRGKRPAEVVTLPKSAP